jgi:hypothetical protein
VFSPNQALALDHMNDVVSNGGAMLFAFFAQTYWLPLDPIGAILISIYIIYRYAMTELLYPRVTPVYLLPNAYHAAQSSSSEKSGGYQHHCVP